MQKPIHQIYSFDEFTLDLTRGSLLRGIEEIKLRPKSFEVLKFLIENGGRLISKDEIIETIWQGMAVTDDSLVQCLKDIRRALNDKSQAFIKTVPRRGYIFEKEVSDNGASVIYREETAGGHLFIEETEDLGRGDEKLIPVSSRRRVPASVLFGREKEIVGIKNLLRQGDVQMATLTGAGGSGKTRLAQAFIDDCFSEFADGVFFVALAAVHDSELVVSTIANTLSVKESRGKTLTENLINFLREKRLLLVLDNFEQIISAAPMLTQLTDALPKLKILITSRAALRLSDEYELIVPPLAVPPKGSSLKIDELKNYSAVELFIARAQTAKTNFIFDNNNASVIGEICARLDGLPLAIELAAARVKLLSPPAILSRLENSLKFLTSRTLDLPARQQTMRGVVEWSYDLLDTDEKLLFNRLAVFAGGFTIEAAEAVCAFVVPPSGGNFSNQSTRLESELQPPEGGTTNILELQPPEGGTTNILDLLTSLIDKNLLVAKEQSGGEMRLWMLEVIREFALEQLETSGEAEIFKRNHAEYFLALAEEADPHLQAADAGEWLNRLEDEHDNLRAVIEWSAKQDSEILPRLAGALRDFWLFHGHLSEGRIQLENALKNYSSTTSSVRWKVLNGIGKIAWRQGDYQSAHNFLTESLAESKTSGNKYQLAVSSRGLGEVTYLQGEYSTARSFLEESVTIGKELGDERVIGLALNALGEIARLEGKYATASSLYKEALILFKQIGNKTGISNSLCNLGAVAYYKGDFKLANSQYAEALAIAQALEFKSNISISLDGFAALAAEQKEWKKSAQLAGAAEQLRETIGYEMETPDREFCSKYLEKVRTALGETAFAENLQAGQLLKLNEAIALAESDKTDFAENAGAQNSTLAIYTEETAGIHLVIEEVSEPSAVADGFPLQQRKDWRKGDFLNAVKQNRRTAIFALASFVVVVTAFAAWRFYPKQNAEKTPQMSALLFQNAEVKNITHVGNIVNNAISPDGRYVVFTMSDAKGESLWLRQLATDSTQQVIAPTDVRFFGVSFSHDGNYIYFLRGKRANPYPRTLFRIPTLGGVTEKILDDMNWCPSFSPDGSRMTFVRNSPEKNDSRLMIADADGTGERTIAVRSLNEAYSFPAWSPDGQTIAATAGSAELGDSFRDVVAVNISDGVEKTLTTRKWYWIMQAVWLADGSGLIMSANPKKGYFFTQLWLLSYPNGETRQITNDSNNYDYISLTADSRTLLAHHVELLTHIWIAPEGDAARARRVSSGLGDYKEVRWTPDGKLAFTAFGSKNLDVYLREIDGAENKQLTVNAGTNWGNEVSSDNRYIVFGSDRTGDFHVWRMDIDGGNPVQLTNGSGEKFAEISPDGKWVVYTAFQDWTLWKISIEGGEPVKIADAYARQSAISPDGKWIVYMASENNRQIIMPFEGTLPAKTLDLPPDAPQLQSVRWSPDSQAIQFIVKRDGVENIWQMPLDGGLPKQITNFTSDHIYSYDWSNDGKTLAVIRGAWTADMVLMSQK